MMLPCLLYLYQGVHFILFVAVVAFPSQLLSVSVQQWPPPLIHFNSSLLLRKLFPAEGSRLDLECPPIRRHRSVAAVAEEEVHQIKKEQIRWFLNGQPLGRHSAVLSLPSMSRTESGLYSCYASNGEEGGAFSPHVNVSVQYFDGFVEESTEIIERKKFIPHHPFVLRPPRLRADEHLKRNIRWNWFRNGIQLKSDGINHFVSALDGELLVLDPTPSADYHRYRVQVHLEDAEGQWWQGKSFTSKEYKVQIDPDSLSTEPPFSIVRRPADIQVLADGKKDERKAVFECVPNLSHKYEMEIHWSLNAVPLIQSNLSRLELNGRRLVIDEAMAPLRNGGSSTHSVVIRCEATARTEDGGHWIDQADAHLEIIEIPRIDKDVLGEELELNEGDQLKLECRTTQGWPRPTFGWYFNDQKIDGANVSRLSISHLGASQFGVFQCEVQNLAGQDISAIWVRQKRAKTGKQELKGEEGHRDAVDAEKNKKGQTDGSSYSSIRIEQGPQNQSLLIGTTAHLECRLGAEMDGRRGRLGARTVWYKENEEIPAGGDLFHRISIDSDGSLWIKQVGPDSIGQFRCAVKVIDEDGRQRELDSRTGWMSIIEKPGMVQNVHAKLVNESLPSKNFTSKNGQLEQRILISWTPGFDGNTPIVKWVVEMRTFGSSGYWSDWELANEVFSQQTTAVSLAASSLIEGCCATIVENVRPLATAEFRVIAHNRFGAGKPSLPSKNVTMPQQPPAAAPTKVHASARSSQSVLVQWQPPTTATAAGGGANDHDGGREGKQKPQHHHEDDIKGYVVRYRLSGYSTAEWNERNISDPMARNALIEPLITWRDYDVQVAAYNERGLGVFSRPVSVTTLEGVPIQAPRNVRVQVLSSTEILLSFDPPSQQMVPGVNLGYKVQLWNGKNGQQPVRTERLMPGFLHSEHRIDGLDKYGLYNLTVLCFTGPGNGPSSEPVEFRTAEDLPGPVKGLETVEVFSESALLQWEPPSEPNGIIRKYLLSWEELATDNNNNKVVDSALALGGGKRHNSVEVSGLQHNHMLEGLSPQRRYRVIVRAVTGTGEGRWVETTFLSGVPPELPEKPSDLSILDVGARKARLNFVPGSDGHAPIKRWLVEARIGQSQVFVPLFEFISPPRGETSLQLETLRPNTQYQLRLISENVRGRSAPSDISPPFHTQQSVPEYGPRKLWAQPVSEGQLSLIWTPLDSGDWNGDGPTAYVLQYRMITSREELTGGKRVRNDRRLNGHQSEGGDGAFEDIHWAELHIMGPIQYQHLLSGLRPFSVYQLRILAENAVGRSASSPMVNAFTLEGVPVAAPNYRAELTEQGDIEVHWEELALELANGELVAYRIYLLLDEKRNARIKKSDDEGNAAETIELEMEIPAAEGRRSVRFPSKMLVPNTAYAVAVQAKTIVGTGPRHTRLKIIKTAELAPDPPSNASFIYKSPTELTLCWSHPVHPKGVILHYGLLYWPKSEHRPAVPFTEVPPNLNKFLAIHLRPDSSYLFALKAQTVAGWGPERVFPVSTATKNGEPLPIAPIARQDRSKPQSSTHLHLIWPGWEQQQNDAASADYSQPRSVELEWQKANEDGWKGLEELIPAEWNTFTLKGLRPNAAFRVRIRFIGDLAHSAWSAESEWLRTMEAPPAQPPSQIQVQQIDARTVRVRWLALPTELWNADRLGYRVVYRLYSPFVAKWKEDESTANGSEFGVEEVPLAGSLQQNQGGHVEVMLRGLESYNHYMIQVLSFNVLGESAPHHPPSFIFVGPEKPIKSVRNLRAEALSPTSIRVQWDAEEADSANAGKVGTGNGDEAKAPDLAAESFHGYRLRWKSVFTQTHEKIGKMDLDEEQQHFYTEHTEYTLTDLYKWTEYSIWVSAFNPSGEGPLSQELSARTLQDVPGPVENIHFRDIMLDSVNVSWSPPTEQNGKLTGYVLLFRTRQRHFGHHKQQKQLPSTFDIAHFFPKKEVQLRTTNSSLLLDLLDEGILYHVSVRAETVAGLGPEAVAEVTTGFNPGAPEAPSRPSLLPEQRQVLIRWQNGAPGHHGPILGHLVQAKRIGTSAAENDDENNWMAKISKKKHLGLRQNRKRRFVRQSRKRRFVSSGRGSNSDDKMPRHVIGQWVTMGKLDSGAAGVEWELSYRELEPSSYYVFRVFARNELGIGQPSAESEQFHVPASILEVPFYTEWWFLALVGALLTTVISCFVLLLFLTNRRREKDSEGSNEKKHRRKKKKNKATNGEGDAFNTLQLSDGGIVSYELYTKRTERGDELFSRPNTKQSWVGSVSRGSPTIRAGERAEMAGSIGTIGLYGSIDVTGGNGGGGAGTQQTCTGIPNMYSALATDAMPPMTTREADSGEKVPNYNILAKRPYASDNVISNVAAGAGDRLSNGSSPPYFHLMRQFNAATRTAADSIHQQPASFTGNSFANGYTAYGAIYPNETDENDGGVLLALTSSSLEEHRQPIYQQKRMPREVGDANGGMVMRNNNNSSMTTEVTLFTAARRMASMEEQQQSGQGRKILSHADEPQKNISSFIGGPMPLFPSTSMEIDSSSVADADGQLQQHQQQRMQGNNTTSGGTNELISGLSSFV